MRRLCASLVLLAVVGSSARADDVALAKEHFTKGSVAYRAHHFRDAVTEFLESYRLSHRLDLLFNIGLCYRDLGDPGRATQYYRRYLAALPSAPERADLEAEMKESAYRVGRVSISAARDSTITLDGELLGTMPMDDPFITAGEHTLGATPPLGAVGAPVMQRVVVVGGQRLLVDLNAPWLASARQQESSRPKWLWPVVGVGAAVVVAVVVVAVALTTGGTDFRAKARASCTSPGCDLIEGATVGAGR